MVSELNERLGTPESWLHQPLLVLSNAWYDLYDEVTTPYAQALTDLPSVRGLSESAALSFRKTINERKQMAVGILTELFTERQQHVVDNLLARFRLTEADEDGIGLIEWISEYFTYFSPEEGNMTMQQIIDTIVEEVTAVYFNTVPVCEYVGVCVNVYALSFALESGLFLRYGSTLYKRGGGGQSNGMPCSC